MTATPIADFIRFMAVPAAAILVFVYLLLTNYQNKLSAAQAACDGAVIEARAGWYCVKNAEKIP